MRRHSRGINWRKKPYFGQNGAVFFGFWFAFLESRRPLLCVLMLVGGKYRFSLLPAGARWNEPEPGRMGSQEIGSHRDDNPQGFSLIGPRSFVRWIFKNFHAHDETILFLLTAFFKSSSKPIKFLIVSGKRTTWVKLEHSLNFCLWEGQDSEGFFCGGS